eukprot:TRINITY_DN1211_c0_g1_i4.p1 TRINITY_DN1211_c0_g1~~TRINITY_DN1211_c0_g1_i4.p1  ORF type:complete len:228 (-),score=57.78 TRINITY_DN1211_c0_g1_i4:84-767(-)
MAHVLEEDAFVHIAAGDCNSYAVTERGYIYAWGNNRYGQIGKGKASASNTYSPRKMKHSDKFVQVSAGRYNAYAINTEGQILTWGRNILNIEEMQPRPVRLSEENTPPIVSISTKRNHSIAISGLGTVYTWGIGTLGQLGLNSTQSFETPQFNEHLCSVKSAAVGEYHSICICDSEGMDSVGPITRRRSVLMWSKEDMKLEARFETSGDSQEQTKHSKGSNESGEEQ